MEGTRPDDLPDQDRVRAGTLLRDWIVRIFPGTVCLFRRCLREGDPVIGRMHPWRSLLLGALCALCVGLQSCRDNNDGGGNGNGNGHHHNGNGNGHSHGNGNGNGNGNGHTVHLPTSDRFSTIEFAKPRLFSSKREILKKTGIAKNIFFFALIVGASLAYLAVPKETVRDPKALVIPARRVDFSSPRDGFVMRIYFREGDSVKKGDAILTVSSPEDETLLTEARLETDALGKEMSAEKDEAKLLSMKLEETKHLETLGSVKGEAVEEARLNCLSKEKRIAALRARFALSRTRLTAMRERMREGEMRAPFDGRLISDTGLREKAFIKEGEFLFTFASEDSLVEVLLKESDYARIELGAKVRVKFYAFPDRIYEGWVSGFKHFAEPLTKPGIMRNALKAQVRLDSLPPRIQNGMSAKVTIQANPESFLRRFYHEML